MKNMFYLMSRTLEKTEEAMSKTEKKSLKDQVLTERESPAKKINEKLKVCKNHGIRFFRVKSSDEPWFVGEGWYHMPFICPEVYDRVGDILQQLMQYGGKTRVDAINDAFSMVTNDYKRLH